MKTVTCIAAAVLLLAGARAEALDVLSTTGTGAAGNCQPALPVFEGLVRKRPLAVANEGEAPAFVTCAFATEEVSLNVQGFATNVRNLSAEDATISCTAVIGEEAEGADYVVKSVTLPPFGSGSLSWSAADVGGLFLADSVALSCMLPPGGSLNRNRITVLLSLI